MSSIIRADFRTTGIPGNALTLYLFDTTLVGTENMITTSTRTPYDAYGGTVGPKRGFGPARAIGHILATTDNVALYLDYLKAGGAWETGITSLVCVAGTLQPFDWEPKSQDWRIRVLTGATAPTALQCAGSIVSDLEA